MTDDIVEWRTTLKPSDAPNRKRLDESEYRQDYYERLAVTNTLGWNGKWRDEKKVTEKNQNAIIDSIAGQLSLTDFQRERARRYYQSLPDGLMQTSDDGPVLLSLIVCGLSANEDGRNYHPHDARHNTKSTDFGSLITELEFSPGKVFSTWKRVRRELYHE